jgi:hypothetical protein
MHALRTKDLRVHNALRWFAMDTTSSKAGNSEYERSALGLVSFGEGAKPSQKDPEIADMMRWMSVLVDMLDS